MIDRKKALLKGYKTVYSEFCYTPWFLKYRDPRFHSKTTGGYWAVFGTGNSNCSPGANLTPFGLRI